MLRSNRPQVLCRLVHDVTLRGAAEQAQSEVGADLSDANGSDQTQ
jgi:hypothetical protein